MSAAQLGTDAARMPLPFFEAPLLPPFVHLTTLPYTHRCCTDKLPADLSISPFAVALGYSYFQRLLARDPDVQASGGRVPTPKASRALSSRAAAPVQRSSRGWRLIPPCPLPSHPALQRVAMATGFFVTCSAPCTRPHTPTVSTAPAGKGSAV